MISALLLWVAMGQQGGGGGTVSPCLFDRDGKPYCPISEEAKGQLIGYKVRRPDKPCDPKYEYEAATGADKPGFAWKTMCVPIMHTVTEKEWQELIKLLKTEQELLLRHQSKIDDLWKLQVQETTEKIRNYKPPQ